MKLRFKKIFALFLVFCFLFFSPSVLSIVEAAVSPWTQSNWSGGSGQTAWSDTTKFSAASGAAVTTTPNRVTFTGSEKLTNTGLESDLTSWTQTAENDTSGVFSSTNFLADSSPVAAWPLGETTSTQSYSSVFNPATATGRNVVIDGTMEAIGTTSWVALRSATLSKDTVSFNSGAQSLKIVRAGANSPAAAQNGILTAGKTYKITGFFRSDGNTTGQVGDTFNQLVAIGTTSTSWQAFTATIVASNTNLQLMVTAATVDGQFGEFDDITVTQLSIPASSTTSPTQLLSDGDMEAVGTGSWTPNGGVTLSKQTTAPHGGTQVLRIASNGSTQPYANQQVLTVGRVYRMSGYARSDGNLTPKIYFGGNTAAWTGTTSTAWQPFDFVMLANDTFVQPWATSVGSNGQYTEWDDVTVSLDNYIRPGELTQDGGLETWTNATTLTNWTNLLAGSGTVNRDISSHGGSFAARLDVTSSAADRAQLQQPGLTAVGKTYIATFWAKSGATPGNLNFQSINTGTNYIAQITLTSTYTQYNTRFVSTDTGVQFKLIGGTAFSAYIDDVSITEIDPLTGTPTNGVTFPTTSGGHLTNAYSFDGSNDNVNIYSSDLNSTFNPSEGTLVAWAKVSGAGVWTDGVNRYIATLQADTNNRIIIDKHPSLNGIRVRYIAGGTAKEQDLTSLSNTTWFQVVLTWSKSNDQMIGYVNGAQITSPQTGLGTWAGNLDSGLTVVGASTPGGLLPWSGLINDVRLYGRALSPTEILNQYNGFTTTRDTGTKFAGTASMKTVAEGHSKVDITQSVNVGDTQSYYLSAYAYTDGSAVTSADAELFYNGSTIPTTYTAAGGGWYQLTGIVTGANASRNYGVQTKSGKTVFLDNFGLKESSATLTSSIFDTGPAGSLGTNYGNVNFTATVPTNTTASVKVRTSNNSDMSGAIDFSGCTSLTTGASIQTSSCVVNGQRYVQYQLVLSNTDGSSTPTFTSITLDFSAINTSVSPPSTPTCTAATPGLD